jgi:lipid A 4'-phosphatase
MGFMPLGLAFIFPDRRRLWLGVGLLSGSIAGLGRVIQGAHFLSDVVFAGFIVYACAYWLNRWLLTPPDSGRLALPAE